MTANKDENEWLVRRCKTKDYHDFPELLDAANDSGRCDNCKLWEEVDAYVATKCNEILDKFKGRIVHINGDGELNTIDLMYIEMLKRAIEAERKK